MVKLGETKLAGQETMYVRPPDCMVKMMNELVSIHVASSHRGASSANELVETLSSTMACAVVTVGKLVTFLLILVRDRRTQLSGTKRMSTIVLMNYLKYPYSST